jgi:hypothetical protein
MLPDSIAITITTGLYKVNAARCALRGAGYAFRVARFELRVAGCALGGADSGLRVSSCALRGENLTNPKSATPIPNRKTYLLICLQLL